MLNTNKLVDRVTRVHRADRRVIDMCASTVCAAKDLRERKLADKTATRIIADALTAALDCIMYDDAIELADREALRKFDRETVSPLPIQSVNFSLSSETWDRVAKGAAEMDWPVSRFIRVIGFMAVEQVHNELTGR